MIKKLYISLFFLLLISVEIFSQRTFELKYDTILIQKTRTIKIVTTWTHPKFILQFSGGLNIGGMELKSNNGVFRQIDFVTGKNYGATNGLGVALTGKVPVSKKGNFWIDFMGTFNRFNSNFLASSGLGAEYNFTPAHKVKYYIGATSLFSVVNGKASLVNADTSTSRSVTIKSSFRIGYQIFTGFEFAVSNQFGFNLALKWTHVNALLKKNTAVTDSTQTELNDGGDDTSIPYAGFKQFAFASVNAGISFYFGVKTKRYKLP